MSVSGDDGKRKGPILKTTIDYKTLLTNLIRSDHFTDQTKQMGQIKEKMANIDKNFRRVSSFCFGPETPKGIFTREKFIINNLAV